MAEQNWSDEAVAAAEKALRGRLGVDPAHAAGITLDMLAALAPFVTPIAPLRKLADRHAAPDPHEPGESCGECDLIRELREALKP